MFTKHTMNLLGCQNMKTGRFLLLHCSIMYSFPLLTLPSAYGHWQSQIVWPWTAVLISETYIYCHKTETRKHNQSHKYIYIHTYIHIHPQNIRTQNLDHSSSITQNIFNEQPNKSLAVFIPWKMEHMNLMHCSGSVAMILGDQTKMTLPEVSVVTKIMKLHSQQQWLQTLGSNTSHQPLKHQ